MALRMFVLGRPGVGKTTLVRRVSEHFPGLFRGFYTEEIRERGIRVGFRVVTLSGNVGILAAKGAASPFRVGSYGVLVGEFERVVIPELTEVAELCSPCLIDELGKMEFFSRRFVALLESLWERVPLLLATTRFPEIPEARTFLAREGKTFLLTPGNREMVFTQIVQAIDAFRKGE